MLKKILILIFLFIITQNSFCKEKLLILIQSPKSENFISNDTILDYINTIKDNEKTELINGIIYNSSNKKEVFKKIGIQNEADYILLTKIKVKNKNIVLIQVKLFNIKTNNFIYKSNIYKKFLDSTSDELQIISNNKIIKKIIFFQKGIDISIGGGIYPLFHKNNTGAMIQDLNNTKNFYHFGGYYSYRVGFFMPFSLTYFFHPASSIGFSTRIGYLLGITTFHRTTFEDISLPGGYHLSHSIIFNLGVKHKFGSINSKFRFLLEYGLIMDTELMFNKSYFKDVNNESDTLNYENHYRYYDGIFLGFGPLIFLGFEYRKNNFSFETGFFVGCSFGLAGLDDYIVNQRYPNFNFFEIGFELKFNYYYKNYYNKTNILN